MISRNSTQNKGSFELVKWLFYRYPGRMTLTMSGILIAGIMEGVSIVAMLPLVAGVIDNSATKSSAFTNFIDGLFKTFSAQPTLENLLIFIVIAIICKSIFMYCAVINAGFMASDIITDLRSEFIMNVLRAEYSVFAKQRSGDATAMMINEAQKAGVACMEVIKMLARAIEISVYLVIAILISWQVTMGAALVGICAMLLMSRIIKTSRKIALQQNKGIRSLSSSLIDGLGIIKAIKAMGREKLLLRFLKLEVEESNRLQRARVKNDEVLRNIQEPVRVIAAAVCFYFMARLWIGAESLLVMMYLLIRTVGYFGTLQQHYQSLVKFEPAFWSVRGASDYMLSLRESKTGNSKPELALGLEFQHVYFNYGSREVLHDLNGFFLAHRFIAISGPSGVGKTTLTDMICGLIKPDKGQLLIDGCPLEDVNMKFWRQRIGYVPQDMFLLHDTIHNNVSLGDPELHTSEVEYALTKAGAWDFVSILPEGMETIVGERGSKFSGGQRQRIAIARALVRKPELLILDEVTASLDKKTEIDICNTLKQLAGETTIIAVSHQPALLEAADIVFRLDQGRLMLEKDKAVSNPVVNIKANEGTEIGSAKL